MKPACARDVGRRQKRCSIEIELDGQRIFTTGTTMKEQIMREAGAKLKEIFELILPDLRPGVVLHDVDERVASLLKSMEARSALKMLGFPGNISISINEQVVQGIPDNRIISQGDLISLDMTLFYKGFFVDKALSIVIDPKHYIKNYLVHASASCLKSGIINTKAGVTTSKIGSAIEAQARALRVRIGKEFSGHGIGESHHMKPIIPNFNNLGNDVINNKDFITIEPVVFYDLYALQTHGYEITANTLSAHFEETVLVTETGAEVIT